MNENFLSINIIVQIKLNLLHITAFNYLIYKFLVSIHNIFNDVLLIFFKSVQKILKN